MILPYGHCTVKMSVGVGGRGGEIYPEEEPSLPAAAVITSRVLSIGKSEQELSDNAVYTSKYTILTFLPIVSSL